MTEAGGSGEPATAAEPPEPGAAKAAEPPEPGAAKAAEPTAATQPQVPQQPQAAPPPAAAAQPAAPSPTTGQSAAPPPTVPPQPQAAPRPAKSGSSRRRLLRWGAGVSGAIVALLGGGALAARALRTGFEVPRDKLLDPSPGPSGSANPGAAPAAGREISGPLNLLLVGIDPRKSVPSWEPHADAVLIMHVSPGIDRGYLFSLPRDLVVEVPAFSKSGFRGERTKLTHAMSYGSRVGGGKPSAAQGFQLLDRTVRKYTGIEKFHAGAVLNFEGFRDLVDALGGVEVYIDQKIVSRHRQPDGKHRQPVSGGYSGAQMIYDKGLHKLNGWQALDVARQRYLKGGDYARQRHQQQLIKALVRKIVGRELPTNAAKLDEVLHAVGQTLVVDTGEYKVSDFAYTLRKLSPDAITLVGLPGGSVGVGSAYRGERLQPVAKEFFAALRRGTLDDFLGKHPKLVVKEH